MSGFAIASFEREATLRDAVKRAGKEGHTVVGCWSPYALEGVAPQASPQGVVPTVVIAGLGTAALLYALEYWSAVVAYPLDLGGRPLHSWLTFLIAPIEFGALCAAIAGLVALIVKARLTRLNDRAFELPEIAEVSRDRFVLALGCKPGDDATAALKLLDDAGAVSSRAVAP